MSSFHAPVPRQRPLLLQISSRHVRGQIALFESVYIEAKEKTEKDRISPSGKNKKKMEISWRGAERAEGKSQNQQS